MRRGARVLALLALAGAAAMAQSITITTASPLPNAVDGFAYSQTFTATVNPPPGNPVWSITAGTPPPPLQLSSSGVLSGTPDPTDTGTYTFTVQVNYAPGNGVNNSKQFSITVVQPSIKITSTSPLPNGFDGQQYSYQFTATNNTNVATRWFVQSAAPPGLSLSTAGVLSGSPTSTGPTTFSVTAEIGNSNYIDTASFTLTEYAGQVTITTQSLPFATVGQPYSGQVQGTPAGISWTEVNTSNPPPGIGLNGQSGTFNGIPSTAGAYSVAVSGAFPGYLSAQMTYPFYVTNGPLSITQKTVPAGTINQPYQTTLTATGGLGPFTWGMGDVIGLAIAPATGVITGTPNTTGTATLNVTLSDATGTQVSAAIPITVVAGLTITTASLPDGGLNAAYSKTLAATGGTAPYTWAITSGSLPAGLTLNGKTGTISGTPAGSVGTSTFTVTVTDSTVGSAPITAQKVFTLKIAVALTITTTSLANGNIGGAYSQTLVASGGTPPYTWSIGSGALPSGVTLASSTGVLSGTPAVTGQFSIVAVVQDAGGQSAQQELSLVIGNVLTFTPPATMTGTLGAAFSQTLTASGGTPPYTFAVSNGTLPAGLSLTGSTGVISGTPTATGSSTVTFSVTDQRKTPVTAPVTITINLPATPPLTFTIGNATQPPVTLCLGGGFPVPVTATLTVTFKPSSQVATGTDTSIQFASPSAGSPVTFTVQACGQVPPVSAAVTMGTVAGTITVSGTLSANGVDVTPSNFAPATTTVPAGPPVIQSVMLTQGSGSVTVTVIGYSSTREVSSGSFQFTAASGSALAQSTIPVTLGAPFTTWYTNPASTGFGSQFKLTIPFTISGNASAITGVTVTLANTQGNSAAVASQ